MLRYLLGIAKVFSQLDRLSVEQKHLKNQNAKQAEGLLAVDRSMAIVQFDPNGTIVNANEIFLRTVGYSLQEVVGQHHRMFLTDEYAESQEYRTFWEQLKHGIPASGEFLRRARSGKQVWIQAIYHPIVDANGVVQRIIKYASDVTTEKQQLTTLVNQISAVSRCFAVIEFKLDGTILNANPNFLNAMGYTLDEIVGRHHRIFMPEDQANSSLYKIFWDELNKGIYHSGEFHRVSKDGKDVYILASYNPIFGLNGEITSVVKYAINITPSVLAREKTTIVAQSVAASVTQMDQTIRDIASKVASTAELAVVAKDTASDACEGANELFLASKRIGEIVEVIRDLADQTNLLALNATIESARAGEAGRGFAVVADEVKVLARQTSGATESIESTVKAIQASITKFAASVNQISGGVSQVSENMNVIAYSIKEQSTTTSAIAGIAKSLRKHEAA